MKIKDSPWRITIPNQMNPCWCCGTVVSGNENKLDVSIVADRLTTEKLSLYDKEFDYLLCDLKYGAEESLVHGKVGIVKDDDEDVVEVVEFARQGMPVVEEIGTMIFAEVLGRTLSGRPLLSFRRYLGE